MKNFLQVNRALRAKKNFNFNLKHLFVLLAVLVTCFSTAWGAEVTVTYSTPKVNKVITPTATSSDVTYFSSFGAPTKSTGDWASYNADSMRINVSASSSAVVTYTFTAKQALTIDSFAIYAVGNSSNILGGRVFYTGNVAGDTVTFKKRNNATGVIARSTSYGFKISPAASVAEDATFTIQVRLNNTDGSKARNWIMSKIVLQVATAAPSTYTLTASPTVVNPNSTGGTGGITATITNSPVTGISSGTTTSTSSNTFTVAKATPVTVTAPATVDGSEEECDYCTYRFDSWENIPASVTADVSNIHAKYITTYDLAYNLDGGDWADAYSAPEYYVYGTGVTLPVAANVEKEGYNFDGWTLDYDDSDIEEVDDEAWGGVSVTAHWSLACSDLDAPTGLECVDQSYNTMSFSWDAVTNASSYDVKLWTNSSCTGNPAKSANTTNTTCRFRDLSSSTTYYCKVQTKGDGSTYCTSGGITATAASGTTLSSTRTFKSGETIFFKDAQGKNIETLNKIWVSDAGDVYAYFFDDATPTPNNAFSETVRSMVSGSYGGGGSIYKFVVPQLGDEDHEWTGVLFTRGNSGNKWWNQTHDQRPNQDENLFTISTNAPTDGKYNGSWSTYANGAALVGDMNNWRPDKGEFNYSGNIGTMYMDLEANTEYKFKILDGTGWKGCGGTITNTTTSWWYFNSDEDCTIRTGEAGNYAFKWQNTDSKYFGAYYPQARLKKGEYIYFDARDNSTWTASDFDARFWFKYYDSNANYPDDVTYHDCAKSNAKDSWVYPYVVPNSDYIGQVQMNRIVSGSWNADANKIEAHTRTSSKQNCIKLNSSDASTSWTTYCPPMSSAALSDNGTTKTAIGSGTEGSPYIVVTGTTIKVSAEAESAIDDDNMTAKYNFKVGGSSQQNSTTTTYTHEASTNNTVYAMSVSAYNNYNSTDGTAANSNVIYYKALDSYTISYSAGGEDGVTGSHDSDTKYYGLDLTLPGVVFSKTGYTQTGWATSKGGDKAYNLSITNYSGNADATLYPVWTANTINVTLAKGTNGAANQAATIKYDDTEYTTFTAVSGNTGYRCTGYYDGETQVLNADGSFAADNVTGYIISGKWTKVSDCTLTAHWEGIPYSITYKDEGDEDYSGSNEASLPDTHTYGAATALVPGVKTNYAFAGWYTTSTCTGDAITSIGATAYSSNITLYARWVELDLHEPGVYEKPEANDGYGRPLKLNSGHDYEVYLVTPNSSNGALYAGPTGTTINSGHAIFTSAVASTEIKGDGWVAFKMPTAYGGSESRIGSATAGTEFFVVDGSNENGAKDSRYAQFLSGDYYMRLYVKGYDEFTFLGGDYNSDDKLVVKIDGITQSYSHNTGNRNIVRFSLTDEDAHFIEITAIGTGEHYSVIRGFSLRLPDVTRYTVSAARNNDSYGAVDVTSISNVRTGSTLYVDDNTFTVNGTTVTATAESGYRFDNWTIGGVEVSTTATISAATTVTANFTDLFTLSYDANGGTGSMSDKVGDGTVTLDANTFTKTGYIFAGWATSQTNANAGTIAYADKASYTLSADATLYAVWYKVYYEFIPTLTSGSIEDAATISTSIGGSMTKDGGTMSYATDGLKFESDNSSVVTVTLNSAADAGDIIEAIVYTANDNKKRGLLLKNSSGTQKASFSQKATGNLRGVYTVIASDGIDDATTFKLARYNDAYLQSLKVARFVAEFELTWDFNGGGCSETAGDDYTAGGSVESGTTLVYPSNASMSKPGYRFNGWSSTPSTMPASDLTLTAQWTSFSLPNVSDLDVDDGATLSSIPLSWSIPGICDLKNVEEPIFTPDTHEDGTGEYGTLTSSNYTGDGDFVTAVGTMPQYGQFGVGFDIPATTNIEWISFDHKGTLASGDHLWGGVCDASHAYWHFEDPMTLNTTSTWSNTGELYLNCVYWGDYESKKVANPITASVSQVSIYANTAISGGSSGTFYVRNVRYGISGQNDIDHIVLMRKEGSAATGIADASATKLYEGTKSHYTDASDVTGKNYYYTVFAVHSNGAVSTGVSTSLTLYTITYSAGANGSGTVAAGKKTHGIDFTLSSSTFTRGGFTQDGWSTSDGGDKIYELGATYSTDAALTLYPHWVAVSGPVITNGNPANGSIAVTSDGSTPILSAVTGSTVYIAATPSAGYNFTSWDVYKTDESGTKVSLAGSTASTSFIMPSYAVTVNATFTAKTYTVTLNGNGGSGNTANVTATYGSSSFSSSITNPTLTGYIFEGWYSGEGGTGSLVIDDSGVLQANVAGYTGAGGIWTKDATTTLYAKWTRDVDQAKWGTGYNAFPNNNSDTRNNVTITTTKKSHTGSAFGSRQYYNFGNGEYIDINLASGYYLTDIKTCSYNDPYRVVDAVEKYDVDTKLYINFSSSSTYSTSTVLNAEPILLTSNTYGNWDIDTYKNTVASIPSGAQSARIFADGSYDFGADLFYLEVERTALDCTPSTVTFAAGGGTGTAPSSRTVCGEMTLPSRGSLSKKGNTFTGWSDGTSTYEEGDTYDVTGDVTFTAQWSPFVVPVVTGLEIDDDYALTWSIPGKLNLSTATLSDEDNYFIVYQTPAGSQSYNAATEELTITYTAAADYQKGVAIPFTGNNLESITYDYKGHRVFPAVVKSADETLYWEYDVVTTSADWTRVTRTPSTIYPNEGTVIPLPTAKAITFCANPNASKTDEPFYIRNVFYHCTGMIDVDHVVLMRKEGSAATDTTEAGTATRLYSGKLSHYTDETAVAGKAYYYTVFSVHADGSVSAGTTVEKAVYIVTHSGAENGSYTIKVGDASATDETTTANYEQTITLSATPSSGYVFDHWTTSGTSVTLGNANVESTTFTMPEGNVTVAAVFKPTPNVYYYKDGDHYSAGTYKNPKGETASSGDNKNLTNPWTISQSVAGVTKVEVTNGQYDGKGNYMDAYIKLAKDGDASKQNIIFTIAEGYKATISMKIGGYSSNPTVTLKPFDGESLGSDITKTTGYATVGGVATTENNFNEIRWSDLEAGDYVLNVSSQNAYISEITAQTEQVGYTVSFAVDGGSTGYGTVSPSSITEVTHGSTVSISENVLTLKETAVTATPTAESDEYTYAFDSWSVSDGASITSAQTITASFTRTAKEYTLTWNLDGGKVATAGTVAAVDETEPSGSVAYNTALTAPVVTKNGYDFAGWTPSVADNMPAANTTYTAQWAEQFTVTYNAMTGSVDPTSATGSTANKVSLPEPTKDGYDFDGWYNTAGEKIGDAGDEYGPTAAITLYAKWKGDCDAGSTTLFSASHTSSSTMSASTGTVSVSSGSSETANNGIKFSGDGGYILATGTSDFAAGDVITVRVYNAGSSAKTIGFKLKSTNHNTSSNVSAESTGDIEYTLVAGDIENDGTLKVYRSSSNSGNVRIQSVVVTRANACYTVTYHGNNATSGYVNDPAQYAAGSSVSAKFNSTISGFARTGYEFVEWNTAANGSGTAYKPFAQITSSIDDDIELYAQWRIVIDANNTDFAGKDDPTQYRDVKVTKGATLTLTQTTAVRDIIVETGSTLNVSTNSGSPITLSTRSLSLVGGWGTVGEETKYDMPRVFINSASKITKTTKTINFDIAVDNRNFYPIAVPFPVTVSDVDYVNATLAYYSNYGTSGQYVIKTYNGQARANADMSNCWRVMRDGEKHYLTSKGEASEVMVPGQGYILRALPASGYGDYAVIRFPMKNVDDEWTNGGEKGVIYSGTKDEDAKNAVSVVAYENESGDTKLSNKGWNILGVPYMTCFVSNEIESDETNAYIKGLLNITTGEYTEDGNVYVSVPKHDFSEYDQLNFSEAKLLPGWCFFVQMDKNATLTFDKAGERASAPFRATMYEHKPTVKTGIILSGAEASDKTTILVSDKYSATDYEINADLEKMFGENSYTLATYSLMGETRLAYNAMSNSDATNVIPIGYRAPADGEYTFAINPRYAENGAFEHVNLIDYETGFVTDLLVSNYTFNTERTQNDERFALNVVKAPQTATDITVTGDELQVTGPQKVIINDKLYIIVDGRMYSAEGALVK